MLGRSKKKVELTSLEVSDEFKQRLLELKAKVDACSRANVPLDIVMRGALRFYETYLDNLTMHRDTPFELHILDGSTARRIRFCVVEANDADDEDGDLKIVEVKL